MNMDWKNILDQIKFALVRPLHPQGMVWVGVALFFAILALVLGGDGNGWLVLALLFYICFRDPVRVVPAGGIVAPADGIVTKIENATWPTECDMPGEAQKITINPRFYDVHTLRAPVAGMITALRQISGQWFSPVFEKSSDANERVLFIFRMDDSRMAALEIIGGAMPDRIKLSALVGDMAMLGQPVAYANFGGEVRLYLPINMTVTVQVGQRMIAGETALFVIPEAAKLLSGIPGNERV